MTFLWKNRRPNVAEMSLKDSVLLRSPPHDDNMFQSSQNTTSVLRPSHCQSSLFNFVKTAHVAGKLDADNILRRVVLCDVSGCVLKI